MGAIRTLSGRRTTVVVLVLALASTAMAVPAAAGGPAATTGTVGAGAEQARIARDRYGVPTITSSQTPGVWFGTGYSQAEDRLVQLELTRRAVEGTLSQLFGPSQLQQDEGIRTFFYTPAELHRQVQSLAPSTRQALVAYTDGINAYMARAYASPSAEQALVPYEFYVLGSLIGQSGPYRPGAWQPEDTVAIGDFLARDFGGGGGSELTNLEFLLYLRAELAKKGDRNAAADAQAIFSDTRWLDDTTAPTTVPSGPATAASAPAASATAALAASAAAQASVDGSAVAQAESTLQKDRQLILATGISLKVPAHGGSNAFVVAPWRSADHHALLWGAPQEGFGTPSIDYEEYLHGPAYDAGGMAIVGEPFILIGRNADVSWTTTSEELVDQRIYFEKINTSTSPPTYLFNGKWIPMQAINETIPVAGGSGQPFTVYRTVNGPVFSLDAKDGAAFSMRFASWDRETGSLAGFAELGSDHNLAQFAHSMSQLTTMHNFMYADRKGNIAYFGAGLIPIEPPATKVDPRLPALGDGTQQWLGYVPFSQMPRSINPAQGFLDNWNTKPSAQQYYQQNSGDEYWGTIFRSSRITQLLQASTSIDPAYLEMVEHDIGAIDNGDNTRPAGLYFIPYITAAYRTLVRAKDPLVNPATHPDLAGAVQTLATWDGHTTFGSPAMSIFMNFLEAFESNVAEGGLSAADTFVGTVNFSDGRLGVGTFGGLGGMATYNFLYHALNNTAGVLPCGTLCFTGGYFGGHRDQMLVESVNDAIAILSGTGTQLGQNVPGFGTSDITRWGYRPAVDTNWDSLDPLAIGIAAHCGASPSQNRSTFMEAIDMNARVSGADVLPPGQSGFISSAGVPSPHLCDQVGLFNRFQYKPMPPAR